MANLAALAKYKGSSATLFQSGDYSDGYQAH